jgi:hypothetical protein
MDIAIPAIGPRQSYTVSGAFSPLVDPIHSGFNVNYVAAVIDVNNQVAEGDELNMPMGNSDIATFRPDLDLAYDPSNGLLMTARQMNTGQTLFGKLGIDEVAGGYDMDLYTFDVTAGQRMNFDIDNGASSPNLDTSIRIYSTWGPQLLTYDMLASNDNARAPGESTTNNGESYLSHQFAYAGRFCVVVSHAVNFTVDPLYTAQRQLGATGDYSLTLSVASATPPTVVSSTFDYNSVPRQRVRFAFSTDVDASFTATDLQLVNLTTGQPVSNSNFALTYDPSSHVGFFTFPGFANGVLPDGNYRATLPAGSVTDASGTPLPSDVVVNFFTLGGDADHDRDVDVNDLGILATNWQQSPRTFSHGDFDYNGTVNVNDLGILATRWQQSLAAPSSPTLGAATGVFRSTRSARVVEGLI